MNILPLSTVRKAVLIAGASLALSATSAFASTIFSVSEGPKPSNVGIITLSQVDSDTVRVSVDLISSTYGFLNTGGPHTPFAFNLAGSETAVSIDFLTPAAGTYANGTFSLNLAGGGATPFGNYGVAIDSSAGNGSGKAYYGDLIFDLTRTGGLLESDFIANADGYYFAADLTDGSNTASQAWKVKTPGTSVPDGGSTLALLGLGLAAFALIRRKIAI